MLYMIRHGKTDWNERRKLQGRTDIPLNTEGRRSAENAAEKYRDIHFDICYCSPLCRATETAELLLKGRNIPVIKDNRLSEMCFGVYEGTEDSFKTPDCPINTLFFTPESYEPVEGGESLAELFERVDSFIKEIVGPQLALKKDILIVGHGALNSCIMCRIKGLTVEKFWSAKIENCELIQLI